MPRARAVCILLPPNLCNMFSITGHAGLLFVGILAEGDDAFFVDGFKIGEIAIDHLVRDCHFAGDGSGCGLVSHEVVGVAVQYLVERAFDFGGRFDRLRGVGGCCRGCGNYGGCRCCRVGLYGGAVGFDGRVGCSGDGGRLGCVGGRGRRGIGRDASGYGLGVDGSGVRYRGFGGAGCRVGARLGRCCGVGRLRCRIGCSGFLGSQGLEILGGRLGFGCRKNGFLGQCRDGQAESEAKDTSRRFHTNKSIFIFT